MFILNISFMFWVHNKFTSAREKYFIANLYIIKSMHERNIISLPFMAFIWYTLTIHISLVNSDTQFKIETIQDIQEINKWHITTQ